MAAAANATTTRIGTHLGRRELMPGFMESLHESASECTTYTAAVVELRLKP
jgi:hypothetical protein